MRQEILPPLPAAPEAIDEGANDHLPEEEREWSAAYGEESWAAWKAGRAKEAKAATEADDANQLQPEGEA